MPCVIGYACPQPSIQFTANHLKYRYCFMSQDTRLFSIVSRSSPTFLMTWHIHIFPLYHVQIIWDFMWVISLLTLLLCFLICQRYHSSIKPCPCSLHIICPWLTFVWQDWLNVAFKWHRIGSIELRWHRIGSI